MAHTTIIGSAGCLLAERLSRDPDHRVLLVEAGVAAPEESTIPMLWNTMFNSEADWGFHTEPQAGARMRRIYTPRGKMVGGSGAINAMICMRGLPSDYDRWRTAGCPGWGWQDVRPYFLRIERSDHHQDSAHHGTAGPIDATYPMAVDAVEADAFQPSTRHRGSCPQAAGPSGTGRRHRIYARPARSCRRMRNPTSSCAQARSAPPNLLLLSGIGPADALRTLDIDVLHDLPGVGCNLSDHPHLSTTWATRRPAGLAGMSPDERGQELETRHASRTGLYAGSGSVVAGCVRSDPSVAEPDLQLYCTLSANRNHGPLPGDGARHRTQRHLAAS